MRPNLSLSTCVLLSYVISILSYLLDYNTPLGIAGGVPYVFVVLTGLLYINPKATIYLGIISSLLVLLGTAASPPEAKFYIFATNRLYALIVIWTIVFLIIHVKKALSLSKEKGHALQQKTKELDYLTRATHEHNLVSIANANGTITYANDAFCSVTGYSQEELVGQSHSLLKSGEHSNEFYKDMWRTITQGNSSQNILKNKKKDGSYFWTRTTIVPYLDDNKVPYKYVSIRTDITDQIDTIADLEIAKQAAEVANRAKTEFISSMSHEFRTPLNAIIGFSDFLVLSNYKNVEEYLGYIQEGGQNLLKLVNDILHLSAVAFDVDNYNPSLNDMRKLVNSAIVPLRLHAEKKGLGFTLIIDTEVPDTLEIEATTLRRILNNIIGNAIKYTDKGGFVHVRVGFYDNDTIRIEIKDSGMGIPPQVIARLGEPFVSGNPYKKNIHSQSSGLGLYISKQLIERAGGHLNIKSALDQGTTITLSKSFDAESRSSEDDLTSSPIAI